MKIYINGEVSKRNISFGYRELAEKMWFKEKNGKALEISHVGNDETLQEDLYLTLCIDKWLNDFRWSKINNNITNEDIYMAIRKIDKMEVIEFITNHVDILTIDKRALYIMVTEIAQEVDGLISEDEQKTWMTVQKFQQKHQDILSLSYDQANEQSLVEAGTMIAVDEPWDWDDVTE